MDKEQEQDLPKLSSRDSHALLEEGELEAEGVTREGKMDGEGVTRGEGKLEIEGLGREVARHYNEQRERRQESRKKSRIITLKNYNNWVKSMNFNITMNNFRQRNVPFNSLVGLDLCCGKGGDLRKWDKTRMMKHVVFVDIAEESVKRCKQRYDLMKDQRGRRKEFPLFTAEFIVLDCTKEILRTKVSNPDMRYDVVSCQFAFHYCFESFEQARQMLLNATESLKKGGYFFGTLPNADRIVKRCRESEKKKFANKICKIRFECEEPYSLFGAQYFFKLRDAVACPEFLVHFPTLQALATKLRLSLIYRTPFDEFHHQQASPYHGRVLLNQMGALESYPPSRGDSLRFTKKYYKCARRFIRNGKRQAEEEPWDYHHGWNHQHYWRRVQVGTISSAEWAVIRLYLAFCFRKD